MIVDVHSHLLPPELLPPNAVSSMKLMSDVEGFLRAQEESPVDFTVISQPMLMEARLKEGPAALLDVARRCNDWLAEQVSRHPDRLASLAVVEPQAGGQFGHGALLLHPHRCNGGLILHRCRGQQCSRFYL